MNIGEKILGLPVMADLLNHIQRVAEAYEGVYLVGGPVRDLMLGVDVSDVDLMVEGSAMAFAAELADAVCAQVKAHGQFETAAIERAGANPLRLDVAMARVEVYQSPGALPVVKPATLREDLGRRDFTVNSMAVSLKTGDFGELYDFFSGGQDIEAGLLRVLHERSFVEDPSRIFRGLNYVARFGFSFEPKTLGLAQACLKGNLVGELSGQRIRDDLLNLLTAERLVDLLPLMQELGLRPEVSPGLRVDAGTAAAIERADALVASSTLGPDFRIELVRLALMLRTVTLDQLNAWSEEFKLRRSERYTLVAALSLPQLAATVVDRTEVKPSELLDLFGREPGEAVVAAAAICDREDVVRHCSRWFSGLNRISLEISGSDLVAAGTEEGPLIGEALMDTLKRKLDGELSGCEAELASAQKFIKARLLA